MTTTFKEGANGFYCAECRMSFGEPQATCPYCGSIVSNWLDLMVQHQLIKEEDEVKTGSDNLWEELKTGLANKLTIGQ